MTRDTEPFISRYCIPVMALCVMAALLCAPAAGSAADACDGAGKEIDEISAQIAEAIRPCEDVANNPCSKEKYQEIAAQIKALTDRGVALSQQCFGVPFAGPSIGVPPDVGGAQ